MIMWAYSSTAFKRRRMLRIAAILTLSVALITTLLFGIISHVMAAPNQTVGFQGRLLDQNNTVVPDGYYNIEFKIYAGGDGSSQGNPGGSLLWTESYVNNNSATGAIQVKSGSFSVNLGSLVPFADLVDWNRDDLWLSMNIAGSAVGCTEFGSVPCVADGEMLPMKRMTAAPYAMNSSKVGGKAIEQLVQLGQGAQTDNGSGSSIFLNKTNTGNFIQFQNAAADVFAIGNSGNVILGTNADKSIAIGSSAADTAGRELSIAAGSGGSGTGSNGGALVLQGGAAGGTDGDGGDVIINAGTGTGTGVGGTVAIGSSNTSSVIIGGSTLYVGNAGSDGLATAATDFSIEGTSGTSGTGGSITLKAGSATTGDANGGSLTLSGGAGSGTGTNGAVVVGNGVADGSTTLFIVDRADSAPVPGDSSILGGMYYDTTIGKLQCYEADGWGACSAAPDTFVSLSPEYSNAVMNGADQGSMSSDVCSDTLNINNGDSGQPVICGENETYNFYNWTSDQVTAQSKNIFVTYKLPANFDSFVSNSTSLLAQIDDASDAAVSYQIYRSDDTGLTACGSPVAASTGQLSVWQELSSDPSVCSFSAGDSIVFKITLTAANDAHAYVSNLGFAFSNR